jgi:hypothetical protein
MYATINKIIYKNKIVIVLTFLMLPLLLMSGCTLTPRVPLTYQPGAVVETMSAAASLSISKGGQGMSSNGYLLYQRPGRMRLVVLSPFGTTLMEAIVSGDMITIVNSSERVAFTGRLDELPDQGEGQTWRLARWVMDVDPPGAALKDGTLTRMNSLGEREQVIYQDGLVVSKQLDNGDLASYGEYVVINGVPLAKEILMDSHDGGHFRIHIDEPEVNAELSTEAFTPNLTALTLYPLSALRNK